MLASFLHLVVRVLLILSQIHSKQWGAPQEKKKEEEKEEEKKKKKKEKKKKEKEEKEEDTEETTIQPSPAHGSGQGQAT
jgi:sortase (surface protein transpeptidase)